MLLKKREVPLQLQMLRVLAPRMVLPIKFQKQLVRSEDGLVGETNLDYKFTRSGWGALGLPDLRWEMDGSFFQIDLAAVAQGVVHSYEAKNWAGDHYFENDRFFYPSGVETKNPLQQAYNNALALRKVLRYWGSNYQVKHWLVFMNPDSTLRQAKLTDPILLPNQVDRHFAEMRQAAPYSTKADEAVAQRLLRLHNPEAEKRFLQLPDFSFDSLAKGFVCPDCRALSMRVAGRKAYCQKCAHWESVYASVRGAATDFGLLFPERRLTVSDLREFSGEFVSRRIVHTALEKEYELVRMGSASYYH